jgi:hypothetical protein
MNHFINPSYFNLHCSLHPFYSTNSETSIANFTTSTTFNPIDSNWNRQCSNWNRYNTTNNISYSTRNRHCSNWNRTDFRKNNHYSDWKIENTSKNTDNNTCNHTYSNYDKQYSNWDNTCSNWNRQYSNWNRYDSFRNRLNSIKNTNNSACNRIDSNWNRQYSNRNRPDSTCFQASSGFYWVYSILYSINNMLSGIYPNESCRDSRSVESVENDILKKVRPRMGSKTEGGSIVSTDI